MTTDATATPQGEATLDEFQRLIDAGEVDGALALLAELHAADQADALVAIDYEQGVALLQQLPSEAIAEVLEYLEEEPRRSFVEQIDPTILGPVLDQAEQDVAVDVLHGLPSERSRAVLAAMRTSTEIAPLLPYGDETAGGRMTRDFVALHKEWSVDEALSYLRRTRPDAEQAFYLYVVDDDHKLEGVVSLRQLVVAAPDERIAGLMATDVVSVPASEDQEELARRIQHYRFVALPVVDDQRKLVGVVTIDDLAAVAEEEATEDMYRMVGLSEDETLLRPIARSLTPRLGWLLVNLVTAFAAALVVNQFEGTIQKVAVLAVFMPIIAGMGGNAGIQTLTLVVRSLALGEVQLRDVRHVLLRELSIGITNGVAIGLLIGALAYIWKNNAGLGFVAGVAMLLNMATAVMAGVTVPLGLRWLKLDPALASGVFVTMFTDIMGFFFFLGLATLMIDQIT
jgi:magnesium transporter